MKPAPTQDRDGLTADRLDPMRRNLLIGGGFAAGVAFAGGSVARAGQPDRAGRTDVEPRELDGQPVPEPPPEKSAGPIKAGRRTVLAGKVANNSNGTANTIRAFAPKLVARKRGRIIVLSSMQGKHGMKDASSYSASKWGILGLMKSAALELGQYNIEVNAVIPGLVDTALTRYEKRLTESMEETGQKVRGKPSPQQAWDVRAPTVPLEVGWLQPEDISPAAVFLASDAAAMVTGAEYEVTGGDSAKDI